MTIDMKAAILFDLGGTLAEYYDRSWNPVVLAEAIAEVQGFLGARGLLSVAPEVAQECVKKENHAVISEASRFAPQTKGAYHVHRT